MFSLFARVSSLWRVKDSKPPAQLAPAPDDDESLASGQSSRSFAVGRSASNLDFVPSASSFMVPSRFSRSPSTLLHDMRASVKKLPQLFTMSSSIRPTRSSQGARSTRTSRTSAYSDCMSVVGSLPIFQPRKKKKRKKKGDAKNHFLRRSSSIWSVSSNAHSEADHDVVLQHEHRDEMKLMLRDERIPFNYYDVFTNDDDEPRWTGLMIRALSPLSQFFNAALIVISFITCFTSTLTYTFGGIDPTVADGPMFVLRLTLEICFAVLIALEFCTTHIDVSNGSEITDQRKVWQKLIQRRQFWLDIASFAGIVCFIVPDTMADHWLCILPLLRVFHVADKPIRYLLSTPVWFKSLTLGLRTLFLGHFVSCGWFLIVWHAGSYGCHLCHASVINICELRESTDTCVPQENVLASYDTPWYHLYVTSLLQGAYLSFGLDSEAYSTAEHYYLTILAPLGAVLQAYIFGEVFLIVSRQQHLETMRYAEDKLTMSSFRMLKAVPAQFQERTIAFFSYQRIHCCQQTSQEELLRPLTTQLRFELHLSLYSGLVGKTELFKTSKPTVVREIVSKLAEVVFLPGDYVCHKGERGDCMYFLISGRCSVLADISNDVPILVLHAGEYFGEVSLLTGVRRTAYVRADMFSTLASLTKTALAPVLKKWPEEIDGIIRNVRTKDDREKVRQAAYRHYGVFYVEDNSNFFDRRSSRTSDGCSDTSSCRRDPFMRTSVESVNGIGAWARRLSRSHTDGNFAPVSSALKRCSTTTLSSFAGSSPTVNVPASSGRLSVSEDSGLEENGGEKRLCEKCGVAMQKIKDVYQCWCCEADYINNTNNMDAPSPDKTQTSAVTPPGDDTPSRNDTQSRDTPPLRAAAVLSRGGTPLRASILTRDGASPEGQTTQQKVMPQQDAAPSQDTAPFQEASPPKDASPSQDAKPSQAVAPLQKVEPSHYVVTLKTNASPASAMSLQATAPQQERVPTNASQGSVETMNLADRSIHTLVKQSELQDKAEQIRASVDAQTRRLMLNAHSSCRSFVAQNLLQERTDALSRKLSLGASSSHRNSVTSGVLQKLVDAQSKRISLGASSSQRNFVAPSEPHKTTDAQSRKTSRGASLFQTNCVVPSEQQEQMDALARRISLSSNTRDLVAPSEHEEIDERIHRISLGASCATRNFMQPSALVGEAPPKGRVSTRGASSSARSFVIPGALHEQMKRTGSQRLVRGAPSSQRHVMKTGVLQDETERIRAAVNPLSKHLSPGGSSSQRVFTHRGATLHEPSQTLSRRMLSVGSVSQRTSPRPKQGVLRVADWNRMRDDAQATIDKVQRIVVSLEKCELKIHLDCRENWKNSILKEIGEDLLGTCNSDLQLISEMMCLFPRINKREIELSNVLI